jgi:hypothetical protein
MSRRYATCNTCRMSAAELTSTDITQLLTLAQAPRLGVLLGAGASATAGLPSWNDFAVSLLVKSGAVPDEKTARTFLQGQDPALAAEAARVAAGDQWSMLLREALYPDPGGAPSLTVLHLAVADLAATSELVRLICSH